jgi:hypothetical protein
VDILFARIRRGHGKPLVLPAQVLEQGLGFLLGIAAAQLLNVRRDVLRFECITHAWIRPKQVIGILIQESSSQAFGNLLLAARPGGVSRQ